MWLLQREQRLKHCTRWAAIPLFAWSARHLMRGSLSNRFDAITPAVAAGMQAYRMAVYDYQGGRL